MDSTLKRVIFSTKAGLTGGCLFRTGPTPGTFREETMKITSHLLTVILFIATMCQAQDAWFVQSPLPTGQDLYSVHFTDAYTGWVVGAGGTIAKTVNAGSTWSTQTSGTFSNLYSVNFTDAHTGWAVGEDGTILKTTDGGATWSAQSSGTIVRLSSVHFNDAHTGWAVGGLGTILKTTDGGATWSAQSSGTIVRLSSVHFNDAHTGWAVGENGTILKTVNSGTSLKNPRISALSDLVSVKNHMLRFTLPRHTPVKARIMDVRGRAVAVVLDRVMEAGVYNIAMPRTAGGLNLLDFQAGEFRRTVKLAR